MLLYEERAVSIDILWQDRVQQFFLLYYFLYKSKLPEPPQEGGAVAAPGTDGVSGQDLVPKQALQAQQAQQEQQEEEQEQQRVHSSAAGH